MLNAVSEGLLSVQVQQEQQLPIVDMLNTAAADENINNNENTTNSSYNNGNNNQQQGAPSTSPASSEGLQRYLSIFPPGFANKTYATGDSTRTTRQYKFIRDFVGFGEGIGVYPTGEEQEAPATNLTEDQATGDADQHQQKKKRKRKSKEGKIDADTAEDMMRLHGTALGRRKYGRKYPFMNVVNVGSKATFPRIEQLDSFQLKRYAGMPYARILELLEESEKTGNNKINEEDGEEVGEGPDEDDEGDESVTAKKKSNKQKTKTTPGKERGSPPSKKSSDKTTSSITDNAASKPKKGDQKSSKASTAASSASTTKSQKQQAKAGDTTRRRRRKGDEDDSNHDDDDNEEGEDGGFHARKLQKTLTAGAAEPTSFSTSARRPNLRVRSQQTTDNMKKSVQFDLTLTDSDEDTMQVDR
jgi:hypothetical protein